MVFILYTHLFIETQLENYAGFSTKRSDVSLKTHCNDVKLFIISKEKAQHCIQFQSSEQMYVFYKGNVTSYSAFATL